MHFFFVCIVTDCDPVMQQQKLTLSANFEAITMPVYKQCLNSIHSAVFFTSYVFL